MISIIVVSVFIWLYFFFNLCGVKEIQDSRRLDVIEKNGNHIQNIQV